MKTLVHFVVLNDDFTHTYRFRPPAERQKSEAVDACGARRPIRAISNATSSDKARVGSLPPTV